MIGRRRRTLSQSSYRLIQEIHAENDRQRQIDRGLGYRAHVHERVACDRPLYVGPQIDMVRRGDEFSAA